MSKTLAWIEVFFGVWLVIAPFVLKYSSTTGAMWNDVIVGVVVGLIALFGIFGGKSEKGSQPAGGEGGGSNE